MTKNLATLIVLAAFLAPQALLRPAAWAQAQNGQSKPQIGVNYHTSRPLILTDQHPYIWATMAERPAVLKQIKENKGLTNLLARFHDAVDKIVDKHVTDPAAYLATIPRIGTGGNRPHRTAVNAALASAVLYYLTQKPKYAQFSADVLNLYLTQVAQVNPKKLRIIGSHFDDARWTFGPIAITYDFIYPFISQHGATAYDLSKKKRVPFDMSMAKKAMENIALDGLQPWGPPDRHGRTVSNWHMLTAGGDLYPLLRLDNKAERLKLFNIYWNTGTWAQASMEHTILPMFRKFGQNIWPESSSYGQLNPLDVMQVIDRVQPDLHVMQNNVNILHGAFIFPQLTQPDGRMIRYGDSTRTPGFGIGRLRHIRRIAYAYGFTGVLQKADAYEKMCEDYQARLAADTHHEHHASSVHPGRLRIRTDSHKFFQMQAPPFDPASVKQEPKFVRTIVIKHAGVAMIRNWVPKDNVFYGLNGYIGGASYIHSHLTGIDMELYGAGYDMVPSSGEPHSPAERSLPLNTDYRRILAASNTVIVNGTSHGGTHGWKGHEHIIQDRVVNVAAEPAPWQPAISPDFGFATQFLNDTINKNHQQRTLAIVRTGPTTGYYIDIFRSRSLGENKFQDYILHNVANSVTITNAQGKALQLSPTERYNNNIGDNVKSPGWDYFKHTQTTAPTTDSIRVTFKIDRGDRYMHVAIPGGVERSYTEGQAPPTPEYRVGEGAPRPSASVMRNGQPTKVLVIRQNGAAWLHPYVTVLEPSMTATPTVQSVTSLHDGGRTVGAKVVSEVNGATITDRILDLGEASAHVKLPHSGIEFTGRFAIVRTETQKGQPT